MNDPVTHPAPNTDIAVMNNNIGYIQRDIGEIKQSIKELSGVYATQISVTDGNAAFEKRIKSLEESSTFQKWISPAIASVVGSALTYLLIFYLSHLK